MAVLSRILRNRPSIFLFLVFLAGGTKTLSALSMAEVDRSLDRFSDAIYWESENGNWYFEPQLQIDTWYYHRDDITNAGLGNFIGFWFPEPGDHSQISARATLRTTLGYRDWLLFHGKFRADDGVHPGVGFYYGKETQYRADEYYLLLSPDPRFNLQVGQFTPQFGGYLERQDTWDAGLISYPMAYENVSTISDIGIPSSADAFVERKTYPFKNPLTWVPAVWAPLYPQGASVYGDLGDWTYAVSVLNSNTSSRGIWWNDLDFSYPTITGRFTYRPNAAWRFGLNLSRGTYLRHTADEFDLAPNHGLPAGTDFDDYLQELVGLDVVYAIGDWQFWAEAFRVAYDVPNVSESAVYYTYFLETRYQLSPRVWVSARWNEERFDSLATSQGRETWNNDVNRVDLGLGYRFSRHAQIKTQYSMQETEGPESFGERLFLVEFTFQL